MYYMYIEKTLFPITPGKITMSVNGKNETVTLIDGGEVNITKTPGLTDIAIDELILPGLQQYPFAHYENDNGDGTKFHNAKYYLDKLDAWKRKKKPVTWKMIRVSPDGKTLMWDNSMDVTIENYDIMESAENGFDITVKLDMKQYRYFGAKKLVLKKKKTMTGTKTVASEKKARSKTQENPKTYIVQKGDTMCAISKKFLGSSSRWREIYNLNKSTMNSWAKKYGHKSAIEGMTCWIFPGEPLKLRKE